MANIGWLINYGWVQGRSTIHKNVCPYTHMGAVKIELRLYEFPKVEFGHVGRTCTQKQGT